MLYQARGIRSSSRMNFVRREWLTAIEAGPPVTGGGARSLRLRRSRRSTRRRAEHDGLDRVVARRAAAEDAVVQDDRSGPGTCVDQSPAAASSACETRAPSAIDARSVRATVRWGANGFTSAGQPRSASALGQRRREPGELGRAVARCRATARGSCARAAGNAPAPASRTSKAGVPADRREHGLGDVGHLVGRGVAEEAERDVEACRGWTQRAAAPNGCARIGSMSVADAARGSRAGRGSRRTGGGSPQPPCSRRYRSRSASSTSRARSWSRHPTTSTSFSSSSL